MYLMTYPDVLDDLLLSVIPEAVVNPEFDEFEGWLGAERVLGRHVEVVHKRTHLTTPDRNVHTLRALLHATFYDIL